MVPTFPPPDRRLTPEQQQRRDYYEAKPHKAMELLDAIENLERRVSDLETDVRVWSAAWREQTLHRIGPIA